MLVRNQNLIFIIKYGSINDQSHTKNENRK